MGCRVWDASTADPKFDQPELRTRRGHSGLGRRCWPRSPVRRIGCQCRKLLAWSRGGLGVCNRWCAGGPVRGRAGEIETLGSAEPLRDVEGRALLDAPLRAALCKRALAAMVPGSRRTRMRAAPAPRLVAAACGHSHFSSGHSQAWSCNQTDQPCRLLRVHLLRRGELAHAPSKRERGPPPIGLRQRGGRR